MTSTSTVIAKPSDACCLNVVQHEGTPAGSTISIANVQSYISYPNGKASGEEGYKKILLSFPDVHGPFFVNGQLVMDYFAANGWLVVSPDYFSGDPVSLHRKFPGDTETDPGFDFEAWKAKHMAFAVENVPTWVKEVKAKFGTNPDTKYATVGYCFGAPFVLNESAGSTISAGAVAHPAFLLDSHIRNSKKPIFWSCAETDHTFPSESRHLTEKILAENKQTYHFQLFSGVAHGFALRGDMSVENQRWAKEQSASSILQWFERFCG